MVKIQNDDTFLQLLLTVRLEVDDAFYFLPITYFSS